MLSLDSVAAKAAWGKLEEDKEKHHWQDRLKKKKNHRRDAIDRHTSMPSQAPTRSCHLCLLSGFHPRPCRHAVVLDSSKVLLLPSRVPARKPRGPLRALRTRGQKTEEGGLWGQHGQWSVAREGARSFVVIKRVAPLLLSRIIVYYYRLISNSAVKEAKP